MRFCRKLSIRRKLLLVIMLTSMTAVVLASGALLRNDYLSFRKGMARDLGVITSIIAENLNAALYFQDPEAAKETLSALGTNPRIRGGWLYAADGSLFAVYAREKANRDRSFKSLHIPMFGKGMLLAEDSMAQYVPVRVKGERVGTLYVESDLEELGQRLHSNLGIALLVFMAVSFVSFILSAILQRLISQPVSSLARTATRISRDKNYAVRAEQFGDDELGQFAKTFNEMLDEVQRRDETLARYSRDLELEVTERIKIQLELQRAKDAAEESNRLKSEFLSMVSHELRTPLTSVRGYAKLNHKRLKRFIFPCVPEDEPKLVRARDQVDANMQIIVSESERLTYLINDVLDLNKLDAGVVDWEMSMEDIGEIAEHAMNVCGNLFDGTDVVNTKYIDANNPPVLCDRNRILQVLINLISNAAKFTKEGEVAVHVEQRPGVLVISVSDTGIGIKPEHRDAIFERFRQLGDTLTDKPSGTGLGLAICKEIVEVHKGRIWVEAQKDGGSVFRFTLPLNGEGDGTSLTAGQ